MDEAQYPREQLKIVSGKNMLTVFLYCADSTQGLIIISPGHRDPNDVKLYDITYFVDAGWAVLCYDFTGRYNSGGNNMIGFTQAVYDLDAVLDYVENEERFQKLKTVLFGNSLGTYASAAVLQYGYKIKSAVIASEFDTPKEQWEYSINRYTGIFHYTVLSAVNGINSG